MKDTVTLETPPEEITTFVGAPALSDACGVPPYEPWLAIVVFGSTSSAAAAASRCPSAELAGGFERLAYSLLDGLPTL